MKNGDEKNYQFVTSLNSSENKNDFIIEIYSLSNNEEVDSTSPEKAIHNFDELISFFEELDDFNQKNIEKALETVQI